MVIEKKNKTDIDNTIRQELIRNIKTKLNFTPEIQFVKEGELPRTEGKSKKIFKTL